MGGWRRKGLKLRDLRVENGRMEKKRIKVEKFKS